MTEPKFPKKSVSFPEPVLRAAGKRAASLHAGNFSRYIQTLIERDLSHNYIASDASYDVLVNLAKSFHPTFAPKLEKQLFTLAPPDASHPLQPFLLAKILEALTRALEKDFDYNGQFELITKSDGNGSTSLGKTNPPPVEPPIMTVLKEIRDYMQAVAEGKPAEAPVPMPQQTREYPTRPPKTGEKKGKGLPGAARIIPPPKPGTAASA